MRHPTEPANGREVVTRRVRVSDRHDVSFALDPESDDPISRFMLANDQFDDPPLDLFVDLLEPGMRVVDIGAHLGTFAITAAVAGCAVIAVEASAANAALLRHSSASLPASSELHVVEAAASDHDGTVEFTPHQAFGHVALPTDAGFGLTSSTTRALTLVSILADSGWATADLVKIDVEGSEYAAIIGAGELLESADAPMLLVEVNGIMLKRYGTSEEAVRRHLYERGYVLWRVDRRSPGRLVPRCPEDAEYEGVADYLATKSAQVPEHIDGWSIAAWSIDEELAQVWDALAEDHAPYRAYGAAAIQAAPRRVRWNKRLRHRLRELRSDTDVSVRTASAWSARSEPFLMAWWLGARFKASLVSWSRSPRHGRP